MSDESPTQPEVIHPPLPTVAKLRRLAYAKHSDPIFFKWQRGEATKQDWLDAIEKVRQEVG